MADIAGSYRFLLNGATSTVVFGNEFPYVWEKADDSLYFRKKLGSKIQFSGADYTAISGSLVSFKHSLVIEKYDGATWNESFAGFFYKTDCEIDDDNALVDVKPSPDDGYDDVKEVLNNEYNLVDLNPIATSVGYSLKPILQVIPILDTFLGIAILGNITNIIGTYYWVDDLDGQYNSGDLVAMGFVPIPNSFDSLVSGYARYLTTLETFNSVATTDRLEDDASPVSSFYNKVSAEISTYFVDADYNKQVAPAQYGKAVYCATPDVYYADLNASSVHVYIPIEPQKLWGSSVDDGCGSYWIVKTRTLFDYEVTNSATIEVDSCYKINNVIQLLLAQLTDVIHLGTTNYSEFLYSELDPIASKNIDIFLTPKSNIVNAFYTNAARKSKIRLSEVMQLLNIVYNLGWHVEKVGTEKRLRIEHISWYEKGGSYDEQEVSIDLTQSFDSRVNKAQSYAQNKYSYRKENMPQRYEFEWDQDSTIYFNGLPINVLTKQINTGQIENLKTQAYTPEIEGIVGREDISLDGWVILNTQEAAGEYSIYFEDITVPGKNAIPIQNGSLSYIYLHPLYHRYNKPAEDIEINGEATTALSIIRNKQQEIIFVSSEDINPLKLITTELGSGQVDKIELNIVSNTYKATINHDTE